MTKPKPIPTQPARINTRVIALLAALAIITLANCPKNKPKTPTRNKHPDKTTTRRPTPQTTTPDKPTYNHVKMTDQHQPTQPVNPEKNNTTTTPTQNTKHGI